MKKYVMLELYRSSEGNEETIQKLKSLMNLIIQCVVKPLALAMGI